MAAIILSSYTYVSDLSNSLAITFDKNDNLYVANRTENNIIKVDRFRNKSIFASGFYLIENIVFNNIGFPNDYLYVMDASYTIFKVDVNGNVTPFATNIDGHYLGMTFDNINNLYYTAGNNINKINTNGNKTTFINGNGVLSYAVCLAFDNNNDLYIGNLTSPYLSKYSSNGTPINAQLIDITKLFINGSNVKVIPDPSNNWVWLCFDKPKKYLYASIQYCPYILQFDTNGNLISYIYTGPFTHYLLAFDSVGNLYARGSTFGGIITVYIIKQIICFKEDTKILTDTGYKPIQNLRNGDLIKTFKHNYKPIVMIGKTEMYHPSAKERIKDQLYKCSQNEYPEVFEDLIITGCHSILVDVFVDEEQQNKVIEVNKNIYITEDHYRVPACVDNRASVYEIPGTYTIYHFALENDDYYMNYGIYANGLLVETCSKRYLKELSNMILLT